MDAITATAVAAFNNLERAKLRADLAEYAMEKVLVHDINLPEYYKETEKIRETFDKRRAVYEDSGRLPSRRR